MHPSPLIRFIVITPKFLNRWKLSLTNHSCVACWVAMTWAPTGRVLAEATGRGQAWSPEPTANLRALSSEAIRHRKAPGAGQQSAAVSHLFWVHSCLSAGRRTLSRPSRCAVAGARQKQAHPGPDASQHAGCHPPCAISMPAHTTCPSGRIPAGPINNPLGACGHAHFTGLEIDDGAKSHPLGS